MVVPCACVCAGVIPPCPFLSQTSTVSWSDPKIILNCCCPAKFQSAIVLTTKRIVTLEAMGIVGTGKSEYQQTTYFLTVRT